MEYKILYKDGRAKRAEMKTVHGTIQTPVFMNVGTVAAIKGAVSTDDLRTIGTQVELSNTYHLHVRTGDKLIRQFGGLHKFMNWEVIFNKADRFILDMPHNKQFERGDLTAASQEEIKQIEQGK